MGNGQQTNAGCIFGAIAIILLVVSVIADLVWGIGFLHLLFS